MAALEIRHERTRGDGVELHVARAGEGPPVILLHGFPENWRSWKHQMPALVDAGFSVHVPDLRGYNLSEIPAGRDAYRMPHLVEDVAALVRATGQPRAHIVGHDWGGIVAWQFATAHAELTDRLVILNAPHPALYARAVRRPPQLLLSWYVFFFLLPFLPERALAASDYAAVRRIFTRRPARPGTFSEEDASAYVEGLARPGALRAALNYYRANVGRRDFGGGHRAPIGSETLVIWGERDGALSPVLLDGLERHVTRLRIHRIPDASHWVQNEAPAEVNRALVGFLAGGSA
jgi:epoxide hydrolase 4